MNFPVPVELPILAISCEWGNMCGHMCLTSLNTRLVSPRRHPWTCTREEEGLGSPLFYATHNSYACLPKRVTSQSWLYTAINTPWLFFLSGLVFVLFLIVIFYFSFYFLCVYIELNSNFHFLKSRTNISDSRYPVISSFWKTSSLSQGLPYLLRWGLLVLSPQYCHPGNPPVSILHLNLLFPVASFFLLGLFPFAL